MHGYHPRPHRAGGNVGGKSPMENVVMEELLRQTYSGKKVFLTGHTGFKGAWMLMILHHFGDTVKGYALDPEDETNLYTLIDGDSLGDSVIADIRDCERIKKELV